MSLIDRFHISFFFVALRDISCIRILIMRACSCPTCTDAPHKDDSLSLSLSLCDIIIIVQSGIDCDRVQKHLFRLPSTHCDLLTRSMIKCLREFSIDMSKSGTELGLRRRHVTEQLLLPSISEIILQRSAFALLSFQSS